VIRKLILTLTLCLSIIFSLSACAIHIKSNTPSIDEDIAPDASVFLKFKAVGNEGYLVSSDNKSITNISIPSSYNGKPVIGIAAGGFKNCTGLESIVIPDTVKTIGANAFWCCSALTSVVFTGSVTQIGQYAFLGCTSLESVYISSLSDWCNTEFLSYDATPMYHASALYLNNEPITTANIPDDVTVIHSFAFGYCDQLKQVRLSENVRIVEKNAFISSESISVIVPKTVERIKEDAFSRCEQAKIYYEGTLSEYKKICKKTNNSTIYAYSETPPADKGNYWYYGENSETVIWSYSQR